MGDEYLWDRSGPVDPEVAALESVLAVLRRPEPEEAPVRLRIDPRPSRGRPRTGWGTTVVAAAAGGLLVWAAMARRPDEAREAVPAMSALHDATPARVGTPPPPVPEVRSFFPGIDPQTPRPKKRDRADRRAGSETLPDRLTSQQIREAVQKQVGAARMCGAATGAATGTKVYVRLRIQGSTGRVTLSRAQAPHVGTPLGDCVARALGKAIFPRFARESMGVLYPVTM